MQKNKIKQYGYLALMSLATLFAYLVSLANQEGRFDSLNFPSLKNQNGTAQRNDIHCYVIGQPFAGTSMARSRTTRGKSGLPFGASSITTVSLHPVRTTMNFSAKMRKVIKQIEKQSEIVPMQNPGKRVVV